MSVYRIQKNKENPYVMINKQMAQDSNLSWKARGLMMYLLSLPDDWNIYESELVKHATDGRDSTKAGIKELIDKGYIVRSERRRDEKGRLKEYNYDVHEVSTKNGKSNVGNSKVGESVTTNNDLTNNDLIKYNNDNGALKCSSYDIEIIKAINVYMKDLYKQRTGKNHPYLKAEQYKTVYSNIYNFVQEWGTGYDGLIDMMCQFLNSKITSDWNINHFATEGILTNRMYEVAY